MLQGLQLAINLVEALGQLQRIADVLPPPTLSWKLDLLAQGCTCVPSPSTFHASCQLHLHIA